MASPTVAIPSTHASNPATNRSTGPRTEEGKARSSQNSRKHGLSAIHLRVLPDEQAEFDTYQNELLDQIKPQPGVQADLFRQLVHAGWSLVRLERYEFEILQQGNPFDSPEAQVKLDRLERYRAAHRRAYPKLLAEIRKLQTDVMLWSTTHDLIQSVRQNEFPMANPASRPLNAQMNRSSLELNRQDIDGMREAHCRATEAPFCKTNSPAAPANPGSARC